MKCIVVIPARYQSSRLPGKPLVDICGKSMIQRTFERCVMSMPLEDVFIATDDDRIRQHCETFSANVIMTPDDCLTGTDRLACVAKQIDADVYINVQGDEPVISPHDISKIIETAKRNPKSVINGMAEIQDEESFRNPSIPKVVSRPDGRLLYMSRAAIPTTKAMTFEKAMRQICIYAFPQAALEAFARQKVKTPLENIEDIEILRFLELDFEVQMIELSGQSYAVDTPEDLEKIRRMVQ